MGTAHLDCLKLGTLPDCGYTRLPSSPPCDCGYTRFPSSPPRVTVATPGYPLNPQFDEGFISESISGDSETVLCIATTQFRVMIFFKGRLRCLQP